MPMTEKTNTDSLSSNAHVYFCFS